MADILNPKEDYNPKVGLKNIFTKLVEMIKRLNSNSSDIATNTANISAITPTYKKFVPLVSQTGTSAISITAFENTLVGNPTTSRIGAGEYLITLAGAFPQNKVFIPPFCGQEDIGEVFLPIKKLYSPGLGAGFSGYYALSWYDSDSLYLHVIDNLDNNVDLSTLIGTSNLFLPEIKVYE